MWYVSRQAGVLAPKIESAQNDLPLAPAFECPGIQLGVIPGGGVARLKGVAEGVGFEPTVELPLHLISNQAP